MSVKGTPPILVWGEEFETVKLGVKKPSQLFLVSRPTYPEIVKKINSPFIRYVAITGLE